MDTRTKGTYLRPKQQEFCDELLIEKYAQPGDTSAQQIQARVAKGLAKDVQQQDRFLRTLHRGFVPAGRINRAIGSQTVATAINCFVQPLGDSMSGRTGNGYPGIMDALRQSAETMRRGGGVGYDFTPLRPMGALVKGTNSRASGPVSYMRVFDTMCETVESAGARRGAQMGILRIDHPDIELFIDAKKATSGRETRPFANFNLSVTVPDYFMDAVQSDSEVELVHEAHPGTANPIVKVGSDGVSRYVYRIVRARDLWERIMRSTFDGAEPGVIFIDRVNADNNLRAIETIAASNPCGEQFLPAYGCCDLGSICLSNFVNEPFTPRAAFDWAAFRKTVAGGVEILDRVLDVTNWPLPEQELEAKNKRRIGLGFFALADAMAMLNMRYGSDESIEFAANVATQMRDSAYAASVDLAKQLGAFPYFNASSYLEEGTFASRLPKKLQDDIRQYGIRNSHLLSIAPTGTTAIAFADNASSGIEPIFALVQTRKKREPDGSKKSVELVNAAYRQFLAINSGAAPTMFVTAQELTIDAHLRVVEAVAPFIDSAISKTINVPSDCPFEAFAGVYTRAWEAGLKGVTTYRPHAAIASVLEDATKTAISEMKTDDPDRRIEIKDVGSIVTALKWPNRPVTPHGIPSITYDAKHPQGDFAVVVGHYVNGKPHPVEVRVSGNEQPRGLAAIAKVLSVDMRTGDAAWLRMKIQSLASTQADDGFDMFDPDTGKQVRAPSLVSGFARFVEHALTSIDALGDTQTSTWVDALFSKREPKTGPSGAVEWGVDVRNDVTGDDFHMTTKEVRLPDGTVRPYSVWLAGQYPRVLDGLAKVLSIDMRISDPAWVIMKLRKLTTFGEQRGDFLAQVPGSNKQINYPSTVAYMAAILLERYRVLGLVKEDLASQHEAGPTKGSTTAEQGVGTGMYCTSCHTMSRHRSDGCTVCSNCGAEGDCG
jgi:ribonucleoside-diphosphate reductase alpha chain